MTTRLGIVVIGRNEGDRLARCLGSLRAVAPIVYVDSGSTDGSVEVARRHDALVVEVRPEDGFTAARARNAGFRALLERLPNLHYVQFVDGDCELVSGWLDHARQFLDTEPMAAVVCGRRRELRPDRSLYNRITDTEWDTPVGWTSDCGGDAMFRVGPLARVDGFNSDMIAGEEPELCLRLRRLGFGVYRLGMEMTRHDAAIMTFGQWWRRQVRSGHAYAESVYLHGREPERFFVRQLISILSWGVLLPVFALAAAAPTGGVSLLAIALYPLLAARVARRRIRRGDVRRYAWLYGAGCAVGKIAEAYGVLKFFVNHVLRRRKGAIIEYRQRDLRN